MTAKQEFYHQFRDSVPSTKRVQEFCEQHHSVQWRKRGSSNIEIRFNDHESWMDAEAFCSNYHNKVCKQLNDLMLSSSSIVTHGELWRMTSAEFKQAVEDYIVNKLSQEGRLTTNEEYNDLLSEANQLEAQANQLTSENQELRKQSKQLNKELTQVRNHMHEASEILLDEISRMVVSKNRIQEVIEILELR